MILNCVANKCTFDAAGTGEIVLIVFTFYDMLYLRNVIQTGETHPDFCVLSTFANVYCQISVFAFRDKQFISVV